MLFVVFCVVMGSACPYNNAQEQLDNLVNIVKSVKSRTEEIVEAIKKRPETTQALNHLEKARSRVMEWKQQVIGKLTGIYQEHLANVEKLRDEPTFEGRQ
jgi:septation ring formation regulator EzrA